MVINLHKPNKRTFSAFGINLDVCTNHELPWVHNIRHGLYFVGGITFFPIMYFIIEIFTYIKMTKLWESKLWDSNFPSFFFSNDIQIWNIRFYSQKDGIKLTYLCNHLYYLNFQWKSNLTCFHWLFWHHTNNNVVVWPIKPHFKRMHFEINLCMYHNFLF
jgi:hypothetical protein